MPCQYGLEEHPLARHQVRFLNPQPSMHPVRGLIRHGHLCLARFLHPDRSFGIGPTLQPDRAFRIGPILHPDRSVCFGPRFQSGFACASPVDPSCRALSGSRSVVMSAMMFHSRVRRSAVRAVSVIARGLVCTDLLDGVGPQWYTRFQNGLNGSRMVCGPMPSNADPCIPMRRSAVRAVTLFPAPHATIVVALKKSCNSKPLMQRNLLHECHDITSEDHAV